MKLLIVRALDDKEYRVCKAAVQALGQLKDSRAMEPLVKALSDRGEGVCEAALWALGQLNDPPAMDC